MGAKRTRQRPSRPPILYATSVPHAAQYRERAATVCCYFGQYWEPPSTRVGRYQHTQGQYGRSHATVHHVSTVLCMKPMYEYQASHSTRVGPYQDSPAPSRGRMETDHSSSLYQEPDGASNVDSDAEVEQVIVAADALSVPKCVPLHAQNGPVSGPGPYPTETANGTPVPGTAWSVPGARRRIGPPYRCRRPRPLAPRSTRPLHSLRQYRTARSKRVGRKGVLGTLLARLRRTPVQTRLGIDCVRTAHRVATRSLSVKAPYVGTGHRLSLPYVSTAHRITARRRLIGCYDLRSTDATPSVAEGRIRSLLVVLVALAQHRTLHTVWHPHTPGQYRTSQSGTIGRYQHTPGQYRTWRRKVGTSIR
eukprot:2909929-Rhodomonas_salina.2